MNKHIKNVINLLGENPTHESNDEAKDYLGKVILSGDFKPNHSFTHKKKYSFKSVAITLPKESIGVTCIEVVEFGEIISKPIFTLHALLYENYYEWVNFFICVSSDGKDYAVGDLENVVYFSSKKFYNKLTENYPVKVWDYQDI